MFIDQCEHPETHIVRVVTRNKSIQYREMCPHCLGTIACIAKRDLQAGGVDLETLPHTTTDELEEARNKVWLALAEERNRLREQELFERRLRYDAYLESDKWRAIRSRVLRRAQGVCEGCLERPATEVHHMTYDNIYDELAFQLVALCRDCHDRCHPKRTWEHVA